MQFRKSREIMVGGLLLYRSVSESAVRKSHSFKIFVDPTTTERCRRAERSNKTAISSFLSVY